MQIRKKHKEQAELHTGPLNDILFILLFFFLLCSLFAPLNAIRVNTPKGVSNTQVAQKFVITVDSLGNTYFDRDKVMMDSLPSIIQKRYLKDTTVKSVVFNGDLKANYGEFVKVLVIANKMGLKMTVNTSGEN